MVIKLIFGLELLKAGFTERQASNLIKKGITATQRIARPLQRSALTEENFKLKSTFFGKAYAVQITFYIEGRTLERVDELVLFDHLIVY